MKRIDAVFALLGAGIILVTAYIILDTIANIQRFEPVCRDDYGRLVECP